jgi:uncharacterized protein YeaO (DUF488 family)
MIKLKRVYDPPDKNDGRRILVERLWPRGLSKDKAKVSIWMKDLAPSTELRKWYQHDLLKWDEFRRRYIKELENNKEMVEELQKISDNNTVTFVYAAHDEEHNSAVVLKQFMDN